jgi:menaquinone-9 beta-reductase
VRPDEYDVAVVGASIAGCTAARLFAQRGARVALIERRPDPDAYKTVCTHYMQASATATIERLGLAPLLEQRGAIHNSVDIWTRYSGWMPAVEEGHFGYSVTRRRLDPALRALAAETPGVELLSGWGATALRGGDRPSGITIENSARESRRVDARLLVAADGRNSSLARLAAVPARVKPNRRFYYWAYWQGLRPRGERARMWILEPDCAYTFPNEEGLTLALVAPHRDRLPEFQADSQATYLRLLRSLPDAPDFAEASQKSKLLGKLELPNMIRPAARPGLAFVGDAALANDPFFGTGCGWAFQSAEWLVEKTADPLLGAGDVDAALARYRRAHLRRLVVHHLQISDFSSARPANFFERLAWRASQHDPRVQSALDEIGTRRALPTKMLGPRLLVRQLRAAL